MATFVQGVAPISYKPVVFDLDFNYIERTLKMRQNMYNKGAAKVKNLYDSLFTSDMSRDDNIAKRDAYLKTISDSLKTVSGLDFSLDQNVNNATAYFQPIINDPYLSKDIVYTKNYSTELGKAERLKNSSDPIEQKKYWNTGIKALQYQREEFKTASKEQSLGMSAPKYVPQVDVMSMADDMYTKSKISVTKDVISGNYIWTMKNGDMILPLTQSMVATMFSQNSSIQEASKIQAYVDRKDFIKNNAANFGGDEKKAEEVYMQKALVDVVNRNKLQLMLDDEEVSKLAAEVDSWEKVKSQGKLLAGSDDELKYKAAVDKLKMTSEALVQKKIAMTIQEVNDLNDVEAMRRAVDAAVTMDSYNQLAVKTAKYLADKNKSATVKIDPVSMANTRYDQQVKLKELQLQLQFQIEEERHQNRLDEIEARGNAQQELEDEKQMHREEMERIKQEGRETIEQMKTGRKSISPPRAQRSSSSSSSQQSSSTPNVQKPKVANPSPDTGD